MNPSIAHTVLGLLAGLTLAVVAVPVDSGPPASAAESTTTADPPSSESLDEVVHQAAALTPAARQHTLDYWTPTRMAAATPRGPLLDEVVDSVLPPLVPSPEPQSAPNPNSTGGRWTDGGRVVATTGRVYLTMDRADYSCSASVVVAKNKDTVLTAGHCLKNGKGSWASNWMFVPGYADGAEPYGRYSARGMVVSAKWAEHSDDSYDFGLAVLNPDQAGRHVADRTGTQRIAFSDRVASRVYSFGYPSVRPYDGRHLHYCSGPTTPDRNGTAGSGMRCAMTQGSSGGPWFANFNSRTGTGVITSVISFKYANDFNVQYGPRLGAEARRVYDTARVL